MDNVKEKEKRERERDCRWKRKKQNHQSRHHDVDLKLLGREQIVVVEQYDTEEDNWKNLKDT